MARMKCTTCGGEYVTLLQGRHQYYHTCPPLLEIEVERNGRRIYVPSTNVQGTDVITVMRDGKQTTCAVAALEENDIRLRDRYTERSDRRDENVRVVDVKRDGTAVTEIKSEGRGTTPIAEPTRR